MDLRKLCLIVEDDPVIRLDLADIADDAGFDTEEICNGAQALERLQASVGPSIDVLLTDLTLTDAIDGHVLATRARALYPSIKIVVVTGHDPDALSLPADIIVVQKPFSAAVLGSLLLLSATPELSAPLVGN